MINAHKAAWKVLYRNARIHRGTHQNGDIIIKVDPKYPQSRRVYRDDRHLVRQTYFSCWSAIVNGFDLDSVHGRRQRIKILRQWRQHYGTACTI